LRINPVLQQALALANQCLQRRDFTGAERTLVSVSVFGLCRPLDLLDMLGAMRVPGPFYAARDGADRPEPSAGCSVTDKGNQRSIA
jgi:hypothetical protein